MRARQSHFLLAWCGIVVAPSVWAMCFQWSYALTGGICLAGERPWRIHLLYFLAALAVFGGWLAAYRVWTGAGRGMPGEQAGLEARNRFLGVFGMLFSGLVMILIAAQWAPVFLVDPCAR
jgi:hypothetical protein